MARMLGCVLLAAFFVLQAHAGRNIQWLRQNDDGDVLPEACYLPPDVGSCRAKIPRFYYDTNTGVCRKFSYTGCEGNSNNFKTHLECTMACKENELESVSKKNEVEFDCESDGMYPYLQNCSKFIYCANGRPSIKHCSKGLHFSEETRRCVHPCAAQCNQTLACNCGWESCSSTVTTETDLTFSNLEKFECVRDGLFPDPESCESYIQCSNGEAHNMACPPGLHFSAVREHCESRCVAQCDESIACQCGWPSCSTIEPNEVTDSWKHLEDFVCIRDGYYADPKNCSRYIQCSNGESYHMPCPTGLHFSVITERCESPCDAQCNETFACQCGWPSCTNTESSEETVSRRYLEEFVCTGDGFYPDSGNCSMFIQCYHGRPSHKSCPQGLHFSALTERCMSPCDAQCNQTFACQCGWDSCSVSRTEFECVEDGLFRNPESCSSYIQCGDGVAHVMPCPKGLHFSEETQTCEMPCDAKCDHTYACICRWETCSSDVCHLPVKTGSCHGSFPRWYYNKRSGQCQSFLYSGCKGNENSFVTKDECERRCSEVDEVDICRFRKDVGPCDAIVPRYYFEQEEGRCLKFNYGGCGGNKNNFMTKKQCEQKCLRQSELQSVDDFKCMKDGVYKDPENCGSYIQCSNDSPRIMPCPMGLHFSEETEKCEIPCEARCDQNMACQCDWSSCKKDSIKPTMSTYEAAPEYCSLKAEKGPCRAAIPRYFYDSETSECKLFIYGGCKGNTNNFKRKDQCEKICSTTAQEQGVPPTCHLPADKGPCDAFRQRWFYNIKTHQCEQFLYSGCRGNSNNFRSEEECQDKCRLHESQPQLRPEYVEYSTEADCSATVEIGPCKAHLPRYYYDSDSGKCKLFYWGGCRGNGNKFHSMEECAEQCVGK